MYQRFVAWCIDRIILLPLSLATFAIAIGSKNLQLIILIFLAEAAYKPVAEKLFGMTLGKRLMKIRVVGQDGFAITWNQSLYRFLPWMISYYATIFLYVRYFQSPGFADITAYEPFMEFIAKHPLNGNTLIGLLTSLPFFSIIWAITDVFQRGAHDRLAETLVVRDGLVASSNGNK